MTEMRRISGRLTGVICIMPIERADREKRWEVVDYGDLRE
jgi:hypothetical protein